MKKIAMLEKASRNTLRHIPQVAILVGMTNAYGRDVLRGIGKYSQIYGPWNIHLDYEFSRWELPPWLKNWRGDGIISRVASMEIRDFSQKTGIPVIDLNERTFELGLPYVFIDQPEVGRLAAEHLLDRGFTRFAYIGQEGLLWSDLRRHSFRETVRGAAEAFFEFEGTPLRELATDANRVYRNSLWESETERICRWVLSLPKPVGIMACNSFRGLQLLEACKNVEVAVPESVAIVTGDNEQSVCEIASPSLTAVELDGQSVGMRAAGMLDQAMLGEPLPEEAVLVPPRGIVLRRSSMITAVEDSTLGKALQYIRENARFNISPEDVAGHVGMSLRKAQLLFRQKMNVTIHGQIVRVKLETAALLLRESDLSLDEIAWRCGYNYLQQFSDAFRKHYGTRPGAFRDEHCGRPPGNRTCNARK